MTHCWYYSVFIIRFFTVTVINYVYSSKDLSKDIDTLYVYYKESITVAVECDSAHYILRDLKGIIEKYSIYF